MIRQKGFTLIEIVTVIVLLGILAVAIVPRFTATGFQERGFYDEVKAALRYAQKSAIAANCPVAFTIVTDTSYTASFTAACVGGPVGVSGFNGGPLSGGPPPSGVGFSSTSGTITFDGAGRASFIPAVPPAATATIIVGAKIMTVQGGTGYVVAE